MALVAPTMDHVLTGLKSMQPSMLRVSHQLTKGCANSGPRSETNLSSNSSGQYELLYG